MIGRARSLMMRAARRARRMGWLAGDGPVILMYHRVAEPPFDPFALCVSPRNFADQMARLARDRTVVPVDVLVARMKAGTLPRGHAAVTFDDGYLDNLEAAAPILSRQGVAATVFVTAGATGSDAPFWWDELAGRTLGSSYAVDARIDAAGLSCHAAWAARPVDTLAAWRFGQPPVDPRCHAYAELWRQLQLMTEARRDAALDILRSLLPLPDAAKSMTGRPLRPDELTRLAGAGVAIGGHALTHAPLPALAIEAQETEISGGRARLAGFVPDEALRGFAYPHGEASEATRQLVQAAGYDWAVTTRDAAIRRADCDLYSLPRVPVSDMDGDRFADMLRGY